MLPDGGATVEVAGRQPDGTWLWVVDQPSFPAPPAEPQIPEDR
ncbi:hypothetical protein [Streptomyces sp. WMMB 714]